MNISILQGAFLPVPPKRGGAIEKSWQALAEAFVQAGHHVSHVSRLCDDLPKQEIINGVHHFRIKGSEATTNPLLLKLREFAYVLRAQKILPKADILVTHSFWAPLIFNREKFGKIYVHVGRYPKGQLRLYGKASRLQVPSRSIAAAAASELDDSLSRVCTLPYPLPFSMPVVPAVQQRPKRVLYVGRIHPEKGVLTLVKAWKGLPDILQNEWNLRLIGPWKKEQGGGGPSFIKQVKAESGKSVEILEPIFNKNLLSEQYNQSQVFAYPSEAVRGETFGLAVLEAMSHGCVPIVSSLACFSDFIKSGKNGLIMEPSVHSSILELQKCLKLLLIGGEITNLSENALKTAEDYTIDKVANQFLQDFKCVLNK
jgi:glycosyltransferase involved in cell wall biosynthesis